MYTVFSWTSESGFNNVLSLVNTIVDVLRYIVPIVLIIMTSVDISKKVINPNDKDGQQKIMIRLIAAVIIFFIPTFIKLVLNLMGANVPDINDTQTSQIGRDDSLNSITITNCPNAMNIYHNYDMVRLNSNIASDYKGDILWSISDGYGNVSITPVNNKKSADISFHNIGSHGKATISLSAGGKKAVCSINYDLDKLQSLSFTNCPSSSKVSYVGDQIKLNTNISSSFKEIIDWSINDKSVGILRLSSDKRDATLDILDIPSNGYIKINVNAGGKSTDCYVYVKEKEIETPTPTPTATTIIGKVSCSKGTYLPGQSNVCKECIQDYYCPGGVFRKGDSSPSGLYYCGNGYTSPPGSDEVTDCKKITSPTSTPTNTPRITFTPTPIQTKIPKPTATPTPKITSTPTPTNTPKITPTPTPEQNVIVSMSGKSTAHIVSGFVDIYGSLRVFYAKSQYEIANIYFCVTPKNGSQCVFSNNIENYISRAMQNLKYRNQNLCTGGNNNVTHKVDKYAPNGGSFFPNNYEAYVPFCFEEGQSIKVRVNYTNRVLKYEEFGPYDF